MKKIKYSLEIYLPESIKDVWVAFDSETPFIPINKGDLINPSVWEDSQSPMKILRVKYIEHLIWETEVTLNQKIMIYSEEVDAEKETPWFV